MLAFQLETSRTVTALNYIVAFNLKSHELSLHEFYISIFAFELEMSLILIALNQQFRIQLEF